MGSYALTFEYKDLRKQNVQEGLERRSRKHTAIVITDKTVHFGFPKYLHGEP